MFISYPVPIPAISQTLICLNAEWIVYHYYFSIIIKYALQKSVTIHEKKNLANIETLLSKSVKNYLIRVMAIFIDWSSLASTFLSQALLHIQERYSTTPYLVEQTWVSKSQIVATK